MELKGSRLRFLGVQPLSWNSWTIEYHHALYWKYGALSGHGLLAHINLALELSNEPNMFNFNQRNSSYTWKSVFLLGRVLVKASFLDFQLPGHGPYTVNIKALDLIISRACHVSWTSLHKKIKIENLESHTSNKFRNTKIRCHYLRTVNVKKSSYLTAKSD
jgi:hypothetical protein